MQVLNVNSTLGLKTGGGNAERTFQMSRHLAMHGVETTILTLDIELDDQRKQAVAPATVVALQCLWKRFYIPLGGWVIIRRLVKEADVIHLMGHWGILNALVYFAVRSAKKPYVVCPAGALPLFGRSALLKRLYNLLVGEALIRNAAAWIAVTEGEFSHFETYGIPPSQITVIPNGVNKYDFLAADRRSFLGRHSLPDAPFILFLGRLNPIKGPDLLLQAYIQTRKNIPEYHLVFAGPDGGMLTGLLQEAAQAGVSDQVHFIGYIGGNDKSQAYYAADLLVIPSRQEAMSIVVLEAGMAGTPVLITDQCGFNEAGDIRGGKVVPALVDGLQNGLIEILSDKTALKKMGNNLNRFVRENFQWNIVISKYIQLFNQILATTK